MMYSLMYSIDTDIEIFVNKDSASYITSSSSSRNGGKFESISGNWWVSEMEYSFSHDGFK